MRSTSDEPKRTAAFHLPGWILDAIETLARTRGTNKSHELARAAERGLEADPEAAALVAAAVEAEKVSA